MRLENFISQRKEHTGNFSTIGLREILAKISGMELFVTINSESSAYTFLKII
jgi:hypothetical protein